MPVITSIVEETLLVVMDRPPVNALDLDTIVELEDVFADAGQKAPRNGVVMTGDGQVFSAGVIRVPSRPTTATSAMRWCVLSRGWWPDCWPFPSRSWLLSMGTPLAVVRAAAPMETSAQPARREIKS